MSASAVLIPEILISHLMCQNLELLIKYSGTRDIHGSLCAHLDIGFSVPVAVVLHKNAAFNLVDQGLVVGIKQ